MSQYSTVLLLVKLHTSSNTRTHTMAEFMEVLSIYDQHISSRDAPKFWPPNLFRSNWLKKTEEKKNIMFLMFNVMHFCAPKKVSYSAFIFEIF